MGFNSFFVDSMGFIRTIYDNDRKLYMNHKWTLRLKREALLSTKVGAKEFLREYPKISQAHGIWNVNGYDLHSGKFT